MKLKIELLIELEDDIWGLELEEEKSWFEKECLAADQLFLNSDEAGDTIGVVKEVIKYEIIK